MKKNKTNKLKKQETDPSKRPATSETSVYPKPDGTPESITSNKSDPSAPQDPTQARDTPTAVSPSGEESPPVGENVGPPGPGPDSGKSNLRYIAPKDMRPINLDKIVFGSRSDGKDILCRRGLSDAEIAAYKLAGLSDEQIAERNAERLSRGGLYRRRPQLSDLIVQYATAMIASYGGRYLFSARGVGRWLIDNGFHRDVNNYVGFGNAMGYDRLELPLIWVHRDGPRMVRFSDLSYIQRTLCDKAARTEELLSFGRDVIRDLIAA